MDSEKLISLPGGEKFSTGDSGKEPQITRDQRAYAGELAYYGLSEQEIFILTGIDSERVSPVELESLRKIIRRENARREEMIAQALVKRVKKGDVTALIHCHRNLRKLNKGSIEPDRLYTAEEIMDRVLGLLRQKS